MASVLPLQKKKKRCLVQGPDNLFQVYLRQENYWKIVYRPALFSRCLVWNAIVQLLIFENSRVYCFLPGILFKLRNIYYSTNTIVGRFLKYAPCGIRELKSAYKTFKHTKFSWEWYVYTCTDGICLWKFAISSLWDTESSSNSQNWK